VAVAVAVTTASKHVVDVVAMMFVYHGAVSVFSLPVQRVEVGRGEREAPASVGDDGWVRESSAGLTNHRQICPSGKTC